MKIIRLLPDWRTTPLAMKDEDKLSFFDSIDPEDLPLSQVLISEIWAWSEIYDTFLNWDDPATPKYIDPKIEADFWERGEVLAKKLQNELGDEFKVSYHSAKNPGNYPAEGRD